MRLKGNIVVGIDGSETAYKAAEYMAKQIAEPNVPIILATVVPDGAKTTLPHPTDVTTPYTGSLPAVTPVQPDAHAIAQAEQLLADCQQRLQAQYPRNTFETRVLVGDPAEQLCELGNDTTLLVVGRHGSDQPESGRIGTISRGLPGHALSSVLIFQDHAPGRRVVVGMDTSEQSGLAALTAGAFALDAGLPLTVLVGTDPLADDERARAQTDMDLAWLRSEFPGLEVSAEYKEGDVAQLLMEASKTAALLVMGKRGLGVFSGMSVQLGRTASQVVDCAHSSLLLVSFRDDYRLARRRLVR